MRHLLLAVPVLLLPLSYSHAQEERHHHAHEEASSLGAHEHGAARLNVALDGKRLELFSPAMNLLGFEHAPANAADEAKIASARSQLEQPQALFGLPAAAGCSLSEQQFAGELLGSAHAGYQRGDQHDHK